MKKAAIILFLAVALIIQMIFPTFAQESLSALEIDVTPEALQVSLSAENDLPAISAILICQKTGQVLYEQNPDLPLPPASITKIMTMLLVVEALARNEITLDDIVSTSVYASSMGGSQIWLEPGEEMTVHELLKAVAIASANDAAVALGEYIAGSEDVFVAKMNQRALELGMLNTNFENCSGLDSAAHMTTARDIAIMSRELISYPIIHEYTTIWMDTLRDGRIELTNTNKLVRFYQGCTGLKTGTTDDAGSCLSATATRDNMGLVAVVMGSETSNERFSAARGLLDYGFANYRMTTLPDISDQLMSVKLLRGVGPEVKVSSNLPTEILVKRGEQDKIEQLITIARDVTAPVERGQSMGTVEIKVNGESFGIYPILADEAAERMNLAAAYGRMLLGVINIAPKAGPELHAPQMATPTDEAAVI